MEVKNSPYKFYIVFSVIAVLPLSLLANWLQSLLTKVPVSLLKQLVDLGVLSAPTTLGLLFLICVFYDRFLWKTKFFCWLHGIPNMNGRYRCKITSTFSDPNGNNIYDGFLEVEQRLHYLAIRLYTQRSCSYSVVANVGKDEYGNWSVFYIYNNKPNTITTDLDMRAHTGAAKLLYFLNGKSKRLEGEYYNNSRDRKTHGKLECDFVGTELLGHF